MTPLAHKQATELLAEAWSEMESQTTEQARRTTLNLVLRFIRAVRPNRKAPNARVVVCRTDPSIQFAHAADAKRALGAKSRSSIVAAILSGGPVGGMFLRYIDQREDECPPMRTKQKAVKWEGKVYPSITDAAKATKPDDRTLPAHIEHIRRRAKRLKLPSIAA
jgi:phosphatidylserine decarboxylase